MELEWLGSIPQLWMEQKQQTTHLCLNNAQICETVRSRLMEADVVLVPAVGVTQEAADFASRISFSIRANFLAVSFVREVLVSMIFSRTAFSLVKSMAMLPIWPSSCSEKADVKLGGAAAALAKEGVDAAVILWMVTAELALPNTLPRLPDAHCSYLTVLWALHNHIFHPSKFFLEASLLSHSS